MAFFISSSLKTKLSLSFPHANKTPLIKQSTFLSFPAAFSTTRRDSLLMTILPIGGLLSLSLPVGPSLARERRNRKIISPEEYNTTPEGIKYYDIIEGKGPTAEKGSTVQVHFDCIYRSITAVSSRESKLLAGNRIIAQPYEFTVGATPGKERKRDFADNANGLYSAQAAPKPPPALYSVTEGMKVGGKVEYAIISDFNEIGGIYHYFSKKETSRNTRRIIVPPELGYGKRGMNEIPPGATFELNVELLQVNSPAKQ